VTRNQQGILKKVFHRRLGWLAVFGSLLCGVSASGQQLGDVNEDGQVTICDAALIQNHIQGVAPLPADPYDPWLLARPLADMDTNGVINAADVQLVMDTILGRIAPQNFNLALLNYDDGDGFTYLQDWAAGTNPFLPDTDGDGIEDEVDVNSKWMIVLARPVVEITAPGSGGGGIVLAQPPVEVLRPDSGAGAGIVLAQPPVTITRE
jgi:hypothetical protein